MATSKCPKCDNTSFEVAQYPPPSSSYISMGSRFHLVQCSQCGSVVGVLDSSSVPAQIDKLEKKMDFLYTKLLEIERKVDSKNRNS